MLSAESIQLKMKKNGFSTLKKSSDRITEEIGSHVTHDNISYFVAHIQAYLVNSVNPQAQKMAPSTSKKKILTKAVIDALNAYSMLSPDEQSPELLDKITGLKVQIEDLSLGNLKKENQSLLNELDKTFKLIK